MFNSPLNQCADAAGTGTGSRRFNGETSQANDHTPQATAWSRTGLRTPPPFSVWAGKSRKQSPTAGTYAVVEVIRLVVVSHVVLFERKGSSHGEMMFP